MSAHYRLYLSYRFRPGHQWIRFCGSLLLRLSLHQFDQLQRHFRHSNYRWHPGNCHCAYATHQHNHCSMFSDWKGQQKLNFCRNVFLFQWVQWPIKPVYEPMQYIRRFPDYKTLIRDQEYHYYPKTLCHILCHSEPYQKMLCGEERRQLCL